MARSGEARDASARTALALIAAFAAARLVFAATLGLGEDESYTLVISRQLALSYFDHPPLHQWIAHFTALALGEGRAARLPFIALFAATGWLMFVLTRRLFDARAALVALMALNLTPFFFASPGAWITPDGPLLFALAGAALALAPLLFDTPGPRAVWGLWLAVGVALGLAGLSKYSAVLFALGLIAFMALSPRQRHWLRHPAPYVAALVALAMISPVIVWNSTHHWISFAFQTERGEKATALRPWQVGAQLLGEIVLLAPWLFVPLAGALVVGARKAFIDEKRLFLLCLALPPIVVFTLTPLWGARGLPHWPMPGWFFVFPLLGAWLDEPWAARFNLKRWGSAYGGPARSGGGPRHLASRDGLGDPAGFRCPSWRRSIRRSRCWTGAALRAALSQDDAAFVVATKWMEAGKIALALGPQTPIFVFSADPRGIGFIDDSARFVGRDGVIVVPEQRLAATLLELAPYFSSFGAPRSLTLQRGGRDEITLALVPAHGLTHAFPLPYPR